MSFTLRRDTLPQTVLTALPFLLFFPVGIVYTGVVFFLLSVLLSGSCRAKWTAAKSSPVFLPAMAMLAASCVAAAFLDRSADKFWSGFAHYQIYIFLLFFISIGKGEWQERAIKAFFMGAVMAATLFYLNLLRILPDTPLLTNYIAYRGNKSILLGILLAIAAGWMFYDITEETERRRLWVRIPEFVYVAVALLFLAKTRTASLLFVLLCSLVLAKYLALSARKALGLFLGCVLVLAAAWQFSPDLRSRAVQTVSDVRAFSRGEATSGDGVRLEMYAITMQMIAEKPLAGHGIGTWVPLYDQRAKGLATETMTTPHNDYLLFAAELGLPGLAALLWLWLSHLTVAWRLGGKHGMQLAMLAVALIVGGMFNAILRDSVFGMAFMVLLAIPLAGVTRRGVQARSRTG